ncbi:CDP-diacylglycerol--inositol 3-phosphatidyltransferase-like isoform X1 [Dreissena polymorpha]|uniref:CDP-diacylglycerol--inositol 3-phosphatidyltransferase n=2 Tax=Dreissena polymorpha TaxID=45954 RepID=A0A9D4NBB9_DREPO|nr:CDP-diacylglycerol--inositol 3-phosphatidyltransferase-like isoform X1 [Dreissena polymorpha]KAH3890634.1 hypothetical protein DPMN_014719 [Dreissena polymorpha]
MTENVFLFLPNIVDYFRVIFAFASFYYMKTDPWRASILYITSGLLDAIDGHLARTLNQGSKLGAMLDMLIDRMATMCLCAALVHFYPDYMLFFQAYMAIDIVSHWFHVQGSLMTGNTSHKVLDLSANPILRHYYHNKLILFVMCAANELFFCMLYLCYFTQGPTLLFGVGLWKALLCICAPLSFIKTGISLLQLWAAMTNIATLDMEERKKMKAK